MAPGIPEHKIHHLPKAMLHQPKLMRCGAGLLQKQDMWGLLHEKLKNVLAVPSHRPDVPGQQRQGGIRIFHLGTAQTSLEADTMPNSHDALCWRVSLGSIPSSSESKWSTNPLQDNHNWQCTKDDSGRVTRSFPARQKARRTSVQPFATNSTTMQSSWSTRRGYLPTLGLPCQLMCTFWPVYIPQGHKELTRILYSSFTPLFPKIITNKCLLRLHHLAMSPSMLLRKQPRSLGFFSFAPSTVWTRPIKRLRATPTNVNHLGPSQERWRSTEFRRTRVSW